MVNAQNSGTKLWSETYSNASPTKTTNQDPEIKSPEFNDDDSPTPTKNLITEGSEPESPTKLDYDGDEIESPEIFSKGHSKKNQKH
jgi:hypothetical protein